MDRYILPHKKATRFAPRTYKRKRASDDNRCTLTVGHCTRPDADLPGITKCRTCGVVHTRCPGYVTDVGVCALCKRRCFASQGSRRKATTRKGACPKFPRCPGALDPSTHACLVCEAKHQSAAHRQQGFFAPRVNIVGAPVKPVNDGMALAQALVHENKCKGCGRVGQLVTSRQEAFLMCSACGLHQPHLANILAPTAHTRVKREGELQADEDDKASGKRRQTMPPLETFQPRSKRQKMFEAKDPCAKLRAAHANAAQQERKQQQRAAVGPLLIAIACEGLTPAVEKQATQMWDKLQHRRQTEQKRNYDIELEVAAVLYLAHVHPRVKAHFVLADVVDAVNHAVVSGRLSNVPGYQPRVLRGKRASMKKLRGKIRRTLFDLGEQPQFDAFDEFYSMAVAVARQHGLKDIETARLLLTVTAAWRQRFVHGGAHNHRQQPTTSRQAVDRRSTFLETTLGQMRAHMRRARQGEYTVRLIPKNWTKDQLGIVLRSHDPNVPDGLTERDHARYVACSRFVAAHDRINKGVTHRTKYTRTVPPPDNVLAHAAGAVFVLLRRQWLALCPHEAKKQTAPKLQAMAQSVGVSYHVLKSCRQVVAPIIESILGEPPGPHNRLPCYCDA